jgi:ArsR family transcriptional regulator, arsenate/arsenite/antimonite-responsive transcriptional repressor
MAPASMNDTLKHLAQTFADCKPLFFALAEVPRQQILLLLTEHHEMNVGQLAERLPLSRPAISHHLKILRQAGLVEVRQQGTENFHFLTAGPALELVERWVHEMRALG